MATTRIEHRRVVSRAKWLVARKELLAKEKESQLRRESKLPGLNQTTWPARGGR